MLNLLSNAAKFTGEGSITLKVRLQADNQDMLQFSVIDTGIDDSHPALQGRLLGRRDYAAMRNAGGEIHSSKAYLIREESHVAPSLGQPLFQKKQTCKLKTRRRGARVNGRKKISM